MTTRALHSFLRPTLLTGAFLLAACGATPPAPSTSPDRAAPAKAPSDAPLALHLLWSRRFDLAQMPSIGGLVRSPSGDLLLSTFGGDGAKVLAFDPEGKPRWEATLREAGDGYVMPGGLAFAGDHALIAGQMESRLELDGKVVLEADRASAFVLSLDRGGKLAWVKRFTGEGMAIPTMTVDATGSTWLAGAFRRDARFGGTLLRGTGAGNGVFGNLFVARLDHTGEAQWAVELLGDAGAGELLDDGAGHMLLAGDFIGRMAFGPGQPFEGSGEERRGHYLVELDASGKIRWASPRSASGMTATLAGNVFSCGGEFERFGYRTLVGVGPDGGKRLDRKLDLLSCYHVARGPAGRLFVSGVVQVGEPEPSGGGTVAGRVLALDPAGEKVESVALPLDPAAAAGEPMPLVPDEQGGVFLAGTFVDFAAHEGKYMLYHITR